MLREEGFKRGQLLGAQQILLRILRLRFGDLPEAMLATIQNCVDRQLLNGWLAAFATAETLAQVGIRSSSK
jgi:hypothetical protein